MTIYNSIFILYSYSFSITFIHTEFIVFYTKIKYNKFSENCSSNIKDENYTKYILYYKLYFFQLYIYLMMQKKINMPLCKD